SYSQPDLFVAGTDPRSTSKNLTEKYDFDIGSVPGGDQGPPKGGGRSRALWAPDGRSILIVSGAQGKANLVRVDAESGAVSPVTDGEFALYSWSAQADGSHIAALISSPINIGDLSILDAKTGSLNQITHVNGELF